MRMATGCLMLLVCMAGTSYAEKRLHVVRKSRPIQMDGFLIEWPEPTADTGDGMKKTVCDAAATPHGLAGYIQYAGGDSCGSPAIDVVFSSDARQRRATFRVTPGDLDRALYAVDTAEGAVTIEWLFPWDSLAVPGGEYEVGFYPRSDCDDTLDPLVVYGMRERGARAQSVGTRLAVQAATILMLLALYLWLRVRAKKYLRR